MKAWVSIALAILVVAWPAVAQEPTPLEVPDVVWITGGAFTMGASDDDLAYARLLCAVDLEIDVSEIGHGCDSARFGAELPQQRLSLPTFGIDRTEVTNAAYRRCVLAGRCAPSAAREAGVLAAADHPVVGVRWSDAVRYCAFVRGRLPSEAEWEKAARGDDAMRRFPWGRTYDSRLANHGRSPLRTDPIDGFVESAPVGAFAGGASPYGVLDLAGNVAEWTRDVPELPEDLADDLGVDLSAARAIRGGSYAQGIPALRVTARTWLTLDAVASDLGFRCAYDPAR